jgi:hypothetical protein
VPGCSDGSMAWRSAHRMTDNIHERGIELGGEGM